MIRYTLLLALSLAPGTLRAQSPICVTPRLWCPAEPGQFEGNACQCPAAPRVWGAIVTGGGYDPGYRAERQPPRQKLRNDDLYDDDDVLAGPRHHLRSRSEHATEE